MIWKILGFIGCIICVDATYNHIQEYENAMIILYTGPGFLVSAAAILIEVNHEDEEKEKE